MTQTKGQSISQGWRRGLSLRGRTFASIISITALVLLLFDSFILYQSRKMIEQNARAKLELRAMILGQVVDDFLTSAKDNLESFSAHRTVVNLLSQRQQGDYSQFEQHMEYRKELEPTFSDLGVLDVNGDCIASTDPDWRNRNFADEDLFRAGRQDFILGPIFDSPEDGKIQLAASPVQNESKVLGVTIGRLNVSWLFSLLESQLGRTRATEVFLIDQHFRFITSGRTGPSELVPSHFAAVAGFPGNDSIWSGRYRDFNGNEVLGAAAKIPNSEWWLAAESDYALVMAQFDNVVIYVSAISALLLVCAFITGFFLSRSITKPLAQLSQAAQRMSEGRMDEPVHSLGASAEIKLVADELDRMRQKIKGYQESLIEKLRSSENKREESERLAAIGTMSAGLAHEIRNPLNSVSLLVAEMKLSSSDPAARRVLALIESEISRLSDLVSNILEFARPAHPVLKQVELHTVLSELEVLYAGTLSAKSIGLKISCDRSILLECDRNMIRQCLVNLLQNAVEAVGQQNPQGGGQIRIDAVTLDRYVSLKVIDDGVGISAESQGKIYDLFFTTKTKGNGFGLSEALKITKLHKGSIDIYNHQPRGSVANLILPLSHI